jgi:ribosomal 30S subunit maturation factor RimM
MADEWTAMGTVKSVNPRKRTIRVKRATARTPNLAALEWVRVQLNTNRPIRCRIASAREHGDCVDLTLTAGVPQDTLAGMRGAAVDMPPSALAEPDVEAWEAQDLVDMQVVDAETGATLGVVTDVYETSVNAALAIEAEGKPRLLLPAVPEVIVEVDFDANEIRVGDIAPFAVTDAD